CCISVTLWMMRITSPVLCGGRAPTRTMHAKPRPDRNHTLWSPPKLLNPGRDDEAWTTQPGRNSALPREPTVQKLQKPSRHCVRKALLHHQTASNRFNNPAHPVFFRLSLQQDP